MSYFKSSKLKVPRRVKSCAKCGTQELKLVRTRMMFGPSEYCIEHDQRCDEPYWYWTRMSINSAVTTWNNMNEEYLDGFDRVWFEVDRVYETRWDCMAGPEGVRRAA
jgi:hypothetical protein